METVTNVPPNQIAEVEWFPPEGLSCNDCINPMVKIYQSTNYKLNVMDQNGCEASSEVQFLVDQTPHIYVPNVFRPYDSQAGNDRFTIFAKQGMVNQILSLYIFINLLYASIYGNHAGKT